MNATTSDGSKANVELVDSKTGEIKVNEYLGQTTLEINYTSQKGWKAIGNSTNKFTGKLDGQGHKINGLRIDRPGGSAGLFNVTSSSAIIESINLEQIDYRGNNIGGLVAVNKGGKLENVTVQGNIENIDQRSTIGGLVANNKDNSLINSSNFSGEIKGHSNVGGLVGENRDSDIINSFSDVEIEAYSSIGGLIGNSTYGEIKNSYSEANLSDKTDEYSDGGDYIGGLVGNSTDDKIKNSKSYANISGKAYIGGLIGSLRYGIIENSSSKGLINGLDKNTGGLVGKSHVSDVLYSYSTVEIKSTDNYGDASGGLVGYHYGGKIFRSYSKAPVSGGERANDVGGLVGYLRGGDILQSYSKGRVTASTDLKIYAENIGGLVGRQDGGLINNTYSTGNTRGSDNRGGLVGRQESGDIQNSYSTGYVRGYDNILGGFLGGLVGSSSGSISDSYWNSDTAYVESSDGGKKRNTGEMTWSYTNTYEKWDFKEIWKNGSHSIVQDEYGGEITYSSENNTGYPALQWQDSVNLTVAISGDSAVKVEGKSVDDGWSKAYSPGDEVNLEAVSDEYWYFDEWSGDIDRSQKTVSVSLDEDKDVNAIFEEAKENYIEVDSNTSSVVAGEDVNFSADVYDQYDNLMWDVTDETSWSIENLAEGSWADSVYSSEHSGSWTVTGNYNGMSDTSTLDVQIGTVDKVSLEPDTNQSLTAGDSLKFSAEAFDSEDNLIADSNPDFTWSEADEGTFDNTEAGEYNVTTSYNGVSNNTNVTVNPAGVSLVNATVEKVRAGQNGTISVKVEDSYGNPISGEKISIDVDDDLKGLEEGTGNETDGEGKVEFYFNETESGIYNLDLSSEGNSVTDTVKVNVTSAEPTEITFNQQPSDSVAGEEIGPTSIEVEDQYGNLVVNSTKQVSLSVSEGPGSLKGTKELNFDDGTASFDNIYIEKKGEYTISAETSALADTISDKFNITSGDVEHLDIEALESTEAGNLFNLTLEGLDKFDNPTSSKSITDLTVNSEHEGEIYSKDSVSFNQSGKMAIEDLNLTVADNSHKIEINASEASIYSTEFEVDPSDVSHYNFSAIENQTAGIEFRFTVEAFDAYDNLATDYYSSVDLSDTSGTVNPTDIRLSNGEWTGKAYITEAVNNTQLEVTGESNSDKSNEFDVDLFEISIDEGINTVSFPSKSGRYNLDNLVYNGLELDNLTIWRYQGEWERITQPDQIRGGVGYVIRSEKDGNIGVTPEVLENNGNKPTSITLNNTEWNLIGHYGTYGGVNPENVGENGFYKHNLDNVNSSEVKFKDYRQLVNGYENNFSPVNQFDSGEAYWVTVNWDRKYTPVIN